MKKYRIRYKDNYFVKEWKIMSIIATKENEELQNSSIDDLKKMLDELGD